MTGATAERKWSDRLLGQKNQPTDPGQDPRTVVFLRLWVGLIGGLLAIALIIWNAVAGDPTIVPASMSGTYWTSSRDLFVGSLCALGVFMFGYRETERTNRVTWLAGICAVVVAFFPTDPVRPATEPQWISIVHHVAAAGLILTLGLFCWLVFAEVAAPAIPDHASVAARLRAWWTAIWQTFRGAVANALYLIAGFVVFACAGLALYTGLGSPGWSRGWPSLYLFEALAVFAFGVAWFTAAVQHWRRYIKDAVPEAE